MFCYVWGLIFVSELVQSLWFEDVGFFNEAILDTPMGRFSIRQMGFFLVFGFLAYITSLVFNDLMLKIVFGGFVFFVGAAVALWKVRTLSVEVHFLYLFKRRFLVSKYIFVNSSNVVGNSSSVGVLLSASLGVPIRVAGVLKNLVTGKVLSDKIFNVSVDNQVHFKGVTDEEGFFSTYFVPDRLGQFQIVIASDDVAESVQKITINVNPVNEKKVEVEKENAETRSKI